jgi:tetratricopeptide (TPR) repeat protein
MSDPTYFFWRRSSNRTSIPSARRVAALALGAAVIAGGYAIASAGRREGDPGTAPVPDTPVKADVAGTGLPPSPDALLARGMSHLKDGEISAALKDISDARRARPDARSAAYLAYCHNRVGSTRAAAELYRVATEADGYERAWVFNNWAYSLCQFGQGPDQYRAAVEKATRALELSPALRPALYNRAVARFFRPATRRRRPSPAPAVSRTSRRCWRGAR